MLRFGTDGVRGLANKELTPEYVMALGRAAGRVLPGSERGFIVGRDTRLSGPLLQAALSAGLACEGVNVVDAGVIATPAVAFLSADRGAPAAVISASHNPFWDNGVKFFSAGGCKLPDKTQDALEAEIDAVLAVPDHSCGPGHAELGQIGGDPGALSRYVAYLLSCLEGRRLAGLRVVLDCANGAAFQSAPEVFQAAGAEVVAVLFGEPDGKNINDGCGSTHPEALAQAVVVAGADLGLAFDGDADRLIAVDPLGNIVDGDRLLAMFATDLSERKLLAGDTVVVTVMTNLGFHHAMAAAGVKVHTVGVGDRQVLEALDANHWSLGGEQSGHIIFRSRATTGDGVLSGLLLADVLVRRGARLDQLASAALQRSPQVLRNVAVANREGLADADAVWAEVHRLEAELRDRGRVLLRPSGTEPLVRVMVEAPTEEEAETAAGRVVERLEAALGTPPLS